MYWNLMGLFIFLIKSIFSIQNTRSFQIKKCICWDWHFSFIIIESVFECLKKIDNMYFFYSLTTIQQDREIVSFSFCSVKTKFYLIDFYMYFDPTCSVSNATLVLQKKKRFSIFPKWIFLCESFILSFF